MKILEIGQWILLGVGFLNWAFNNPAGAAACFALIAAVNSMPD